MAISTVAYSPKEFRVAIQAQTALGTALTNGMQEINVDSISHGTLGGNNNYDLKSGGGRILQDEHYYHDNLGVVSEISISGIYSTEFFELIENITGDTGEVWTVASNYEPSVNIKTGATLTAGDSELLTLAILPPVTGGATPSATEGILYKDCVVTSFTWSGDMNDNSGLENKKLQKMMANDYKVSTNEQGQMQYDMEIDGKTYSLTKEQYRDLPILKHYKVGTNFGKQVTSSYSSPSFNEFSFQNSVLGSLPDNVKELRAAMADGIQGEKFGELLARYTSKDEVTAAFNTDGDSTISDD